MTPGQIAQVCHGANKAYSESIGDFSQPRWEEVPYEQRMGYVKAIEAVQENPDVTPEDQHKKWLESKEKDGWKYGEEKNTKKKLHPCMVPFKDLPPQQQLKDALFIATVIALTEKKEIPKKEAPKKSTEKVEQSVAGEEAPKAVKK